MNKTSSLQFAFYHDPTGALRRLEFYSSPLKALENYRPDGFLIFCAIKNGSNLLYYRECTALLRRFAKDVALDVIHLWNPPKVVLDYLKGDDENQRDAAWAAARGAARAAARGAARGAARAAARAAARDAARGAARAAARAAARGAAWDAAWDAASAKYDQWLIERLTAPPPTIDKS